MRHVLAIVISLLLAAQVGAQSLPQVRPGDGESGLREMLGGAEARAWGAVGRLDTGASFCSATLITPDLVLTAAHCVFHPRTSEAFSPDELTFLAGLRNGQAEAIRQVRRIIVLPDYVPQDGPEFEMIGRRSGPVGTAPAGIGDNHNSDPRPRGCRTEGRSDRGVLWRGSGILCLDRGGLRNSGTARKRALAELSCCVRFVRVARIAC